MKEENDEGKRESLIFIELTSICNEFDYPSLYSSPQLLLVYHLVQTYLAHPSAPESWRCLPQNFRHKFNLLFFDLILMVKRLFCCTG